MGLLLKLTVDMLNKTVFRWHFEIVSLIVLKHGVEFYLNLHEPIFLGKKVKHMISRHIYEYGWLSAMYGTEPLCFLVVHMLCMGDFLSECCPWT